MISLTSDSIPGALTDVLASCDAHGQILVWTVSRVRAAQAAGPQLGPEGEFQFIISRRPQRLFRGAPSTSACLDISWQMGVVAYGSGLTVSLFSVERDELLRSIDISALIRSRSERSESSSGFGAEFESPMSGSEQQQQQRNGISSTETGCSSFSKIGASSLRNGSSATPEAETEAEADLIIGRICLCNDAIVIVHVTTPSYSLQATAPPGGTTDVPLTGSSSPGGGQGKATSPIEELKPCRQLLVALSFSGAIIGAVECTSAVTFLDCPLHQDVVVAGYEDGTVALYSTYSLSTLFQFQPHLHCVQTCIAPNLVGPTQSQLYKQSCPAAAILCVQLGPNPSAPAVLCASTAMGAIYFRAFPDFIKWERTRTPSALAQFVQAPLQAVRGTIQQAQNLGAWTSEQAGALAQNARSFADDALGELKKVCVSVV